MTIYVNTKMSHLLCEFPQSNGCITGVTIDESVHRSCFLGLLRSACHGRQHEHIKATSLEQPHALLVLIRIHGHRVIPSLGVETLRHYDL